MSFAIFKFAQCLDLDLDQRSTPRLADVVPSAHPGRPAKANAVTV